MNNFSSSIRLFFMGKKETPSKAGLDSEFESHQKSISYSDAGIEMRKFASMYLLKTRTT